MGDSTPTVRSDAHKLTITASGDLVWLDDQPGPNAWVVNRFGIKTIDKNQEAPLLDAQGQIVKATGTEDGGPTSGGGGTSGDQSAPNNLDNNGHDDPPHAVDDSVTARAGTTVIIPVTANDWDPDGNAIAVNTVGVDKAAGHGTTDVLNGSSVAYVPEKGYSGTDTFSYSIIDENGSTATANVNVELFAADSANRPPITKPDHVKTRVGHPVVIDVLSNDIDPERDVLSVPTFRQNGNAAIITDTLGPTGLAALKYDPPPDTPGIYTFTYQAADPQGGTSAPTKVTVEVTSKDSPNDPPVANPDAIRLRVNSSDTLDVKANDTDDDGDELFVSLPDPLPKSVLATVVGQRLNITVLPGAETRSVIRYDLSDGTNHVTGRVLVVKIDDTAPNRPPVANPDTDKVVIGSSVKIPVTLNDIDPDNDTIRLLSVDQPAGGVGSTTREDDSVRFTPNLPKITEPTPVSFTYHITDGKGNDVSGTVTVTVLVEALPKAPFARDDFADTVTDKPVTIDVLANDSDPSGGTPSLAGSPGCPNGGEATITDNQRVTFTPPLGGVGTYRCKYTIRNTGGLDSQASIIVTVTTAPPGNHDPVINNALLQTDLSVGKPLVFNANSLAHDDDIGDTLVFVSVGKPEHGSTDFSQKASSFTYTAPPTGSTDSTPVVDNFDVTISDGNNGNARGTISIRITDPTPAATPPNTHDVSMTATVGQLTRFDVVSELQAANPNATLTLVGASADSPTPDAAIDTSGGTVLITPKAAGTLSITYTVKDADTLLKASGRLRLTIADAPPANPPPVAVADDLTVASGGSNSVDLLANDLGITDPGDKATVVLVNRPPASFGTVDLTNGVLTLTAGPGASGGQAVIRYSLDDGSGQTSTATVTLTILACSESAPQVLPARLFTPYQTPIAIDLNQYVVSGTIVPGSVSGAGLTGPVGTFTPPAGMNGAVQVTYTVTNSCHEIDHGLLTIDVNRAPVGGDITRNLARGDSLTLAASDLASDDEPLTITAINGNPPWVSLVDAATINASPSNAVGSGIYTFTVLVEDPGGLTATATIHLSISNLPPTAIADEYFTQFSQLTFDPTVNDFDSEPGPLAVQLVTPVDGGGVLLGIAGNAVTVALPHGVSTFSYTIVDGGGLTDSSTITITSNSPPSAPDVSDSTNQPTINVNLSPVDPDGDAVDVRCNSTAVFDVVVVPNPNPSNPAEANRVTLHVTVLPDHFNGTDSFTCTSTDTFGARTTSTVTLTVND